MAKVNSNNGNASRFAPRTIGLVVSFAILIVSYHNLFKHTVLNTSLVYDSTGARMSPILVRYTNAFTIASLLISALILLSLYLGKITGRRIALILLILLSGLIIYTAPVTDTAIAGANVIAIYLPWFFFLYIGPVLIGLLVGKIVERFLAQRHKPNFIL